MPDKPTITQQLIHLRGQFASSVERLIASKKGPSIAKEKQGKKKKTLSAEQRQQALNTQADEALQTAKIHTKNIQTFINENDPSLQVTLNTLLGEIQQHIESYLNDRLNEETSLEEEAKDDVIKKINDALSNLPQVESKPPPEDDTLVPDELMAAAPGNTVSNYAFSLQTYEAILPYAKVAYASEKNGIPEEHAYKLAVLFGDLDTAIHYLATYDRTHILKPDPFHQACLVTLPSENGWNISVWQALAKQNLGNPAFFHCLTEAKKIEEKLTIGLDKLKTLEKELTLQSKDKNAQKVSEIRTEITALRKKTGISGKASIIFSSKIPIKILEHYEATLTFPRGPENPDAARIFKKYRGATNKDFEEWLDLRPDDSEQIPSAVLDGTSLGYKNYYIKKLPSSDPHAPLLGHITGCCQHLSGAAREAVIRGITSPRDGFYVLSKGNPDDPQPNDEIKPQSWAWRSKKNALVLDSIEANAAAANGIVDEKGTTGTTMIADMFKQFAIKLVEDYGIPKVTVGRSNIAINTMTVKGYGEHESPEQPVDFDGYRDSHQQTILAIKDLPYYAWANKPGDQKLSKQLIEFINHKTPGTDESLQILFKWAMHNAKFEIPDEVDETFTQIGYTALLFIALGGDNVELIEQLIKRGADLHLTNLNKESFLHIAVKHGYTDITTLFIKEGAPIDTTDASGNTPLHLVLKKGHTNIAKLLIEKRAKLDTVNETGNSPLHIALKHGHTDLAKLLISNGAPLNVQNTNSKTPIDLILLNKDLTKDTMFHQTLVDFMKEKAKEVAEDEPSYTQNDINHIFCLIHENNLDFTFEEVPGFISENLDYKKLFDRLNKTKDSLEITQLIKKGLNINHTIGGNQPILRWAVENKHWDLVSLLATEYKDEIYAVDLNATLEMAMDCDDKDIFQLYLQHPKINVNHKFTSWENGQSAEHSLLVIAAKTGQKEIVELLLEHPNIQINPRAPYFFYDYLAETSALAAAAEKGHLDIVKILLNTSGIDANQPVWYENVVDVPTLLTWSIRNNHEDIFNLLITKNVDTIDVNQPTRNHRHTPLHLAIARNKFELVQKLLKIPGIDVNKTNVQGINPLTAASANNLKKIVELLLPLTKDPNQESNYGDTPLNLAAQLGRREMVDFLLEQDAIDAGYKNKEGKTAADIAEDHNHPDIAARIRAKIATPAPDEGRGFQAS